MRYLSGGPFHKSAIKEGEKVMEFYFTHLPLSSLRRVKVTLVPSTTTSRLSSLTLLVVEAVLKFKSSTKMTRIRVNMIDEAI